MAELVGDEACRAAEALLRVVRVDEEDVRRGTERRRESMRGFGWTTVLVSDGVDRGSSGMGLNCEGERVSTGCGGLVEGECGGGAVNCGGSSDRTRCGRRRFCRAVISSSVKPASAREEDQEGGRPCRSPLTCTLCFTICDGISMAYSQQTIDIYLKVPGLRDAPFN